LRCITRPPPAPRRPPLRLCRQTPPPFVPTPHPHPPGPLKGVIPSLNRLYVSHTELANFFRALASLLDLPADAGPGAAVAAIRQLIAAAGRCAGGAPGPEGGVQGARARVEGLA
jgi:hypothetical protein